jgi:hypothetical protein
VAVTILVRNMVAELGEVAAVTAALDIRSYLPVDASGGSTEAARGPLGPGSSAEDGDHAGF